MGFDVGNWVILDGFGIEFVEVFLWIICVYVW